MGFTGFTRAGRFGVCVSVFRVVEAQFSPLP